ncbi:HD-GYP domain-containing protein [Alicyclobacillus sp. SO9]|uniref:HD-GYP domain-containing protein n=1 Tax=Alicyclobacillus sp. SO9 TaxID=2665646 RepID=UPI0018E9029D|nr:HD-GYP domain-containing protein [Alicyclobacillus sp. SO9]QQE79427.1 HD-GYP domain-containing protein [Alicyclobacillus sp. SO9]
MRWVALKNLGEHRVLAQNILDERGRVLLAKGVELTDGRAERLAKLGLFSACVEDPATEDIELEEVVSQRLRGELVSATYDSLVELVQMEGTKHIRASNVKRKLQPLVDDVLGQLKSIEGASQHLGNVYVTDGELYHHSVNVTLFALTLGIDQGLNSHDLVELGIGSLLHDVGKLKVPGSVLRKPGKLSKDEFEQIKRHAGYGYEILRSLPDISAKSALIALEHHERLDGMGYPRGLRKDEIHQYSRIVSVADVYEALTANRVYRKGYLPHEALELLLGGGGMQFDESIVESFVKTVAVYPTGVTVKLSTGEKAVVVESKPKQSHRPIVRVIEDPYGKRLDKSYNLDLSTELTLEIVAWES